MVCLIAIMFNYFKYKYIYWDTACMVASYWSNLIRYECAVDLGSCVKPFESNTLHTTVLAIFTVSTTVKPVNQDT